jgi:hypothetical protein
VWGAVTIRKEENDDLGDAYWDTEGLFAEDGNSCGLVLVLILVDGLDWLSFTDGSGKGSLSREEE